jgi:hypothetical protein
VLQKEALEGSEMAAFLDTDGISYRLHQLISNSKETLILISPYLSISERVKRLLEDKEGSEQVQIWVVYGKEELKPAEGSWLKSRKGIKSKFIRNMHTKCCLNEGEAIVTSMNLYDFSQTNNYEMGIYVSKDGDPGLYCAIKDEVMGYLRMLDEAKPPDVEVHKEADKTTALTTTALGFCIRCRRETKTPSHMFPFCSGCYNEWERDGASIYRQEKFCLICGIQKGHITKKQPICSKECYDRYQKHIGSLESAPVPAGSTAR